MDPPSLPSAQSSSSSSSASPLPGFQSASFVLKASAGSLRNAGGGQPAIPNPQVPPDAPGSTDGSSNGTNGQVAATPAPPKAKPINRPASSKNAIIYNAVQRRNPVVGSIKNVGIEIGDIVADYQVGTHNGVLFLSLKYHRLHPEYIHQRIEKMKNMYTARILLILCDINEHQQSIRELSKVAIINNLTIIVAWNNDEVAQYLTTFKAYEHKSDDSLKEKVHQAYHDQLQHVLTSGKKVNKTDADNLASQFGPFSDIVKQPSKLLSGVKGLGATKVTSLLDAFNKPFLVGGLKRDAEAETIIVTSNGIGKAIDARAESFENVGSSEWPDEEDVEEDAEEEEEDTSRGRARAPSRSPGVSPERAEEPEEGEVAAEVWRDPLDDEDDEESEPRSKRIRLEG